MKNVIKGGRESRHSGSGVEGIGKTLSLVLDLRNCMNCLVPGQGILLFNVCVCVCVLILDMIVMSECVEFMTVI